MQLIKNQIITLFESEILTFEIIKSCPKIETSFRIKTPIWSF